MQNFRRNFVPLALTMVLFACGSDAGEPVAPPEDTRQSAVATTAAGQVEVDTSAAGGDTTPGTGGGGGECTVTVTGDREDTWTFAQSVYSVSTDHWMSEEELRETVAALGEDVFGASYEELAARGEPVVTFLSLSCVDPDQLLQGASVSHSNATTKADFPMGPGSYPIAGGLLAGDIPAGTMFADFNADSDELYGTVAGSGSLEITRWDLARIEGSYSFDATEAFADNPRQVRVSVTFSFACAGWFSGC
jgi:hypothetical protein